MHKLNLGLLLLVLVTNIVVFGSFYPLLYLTAALLHEFGHIFAMSKYLNKKGFFKYVGVGIRISETKRLSYCQDLAVAAAGPIVNLCAVIIFIILSLFLKTEVLFHMIVSNGLYAVMNLMPIAPLDGYKILNDIIMLKAQYRCGRIVLNTIGVICLLFYGIVIVKLYFDEIINISLILIFVLLLFGTLFQTDI